ncbi:MAG: hypothetical protein JWM41_3378 [Gemmatimonadetes bacterium]|nr:hypothetical protein [Gemmatimonadota bacterium]
MAAVVAFAIAAVAFAAAAFVAIRPDPTRTVPRDERQWTDALRSSDPRVRARVLSVYALTATEPALHPPCDPVIARLVDVPSVRDEALAVLIKEARDRRCITEVIAVLADSPDAYARSAAAHVLGEASAPSMRTPVVDALVRAIGRDSAARDAAIVALGVLSDTGAAARSALRRAFTETNGETRANALEALLHVDPAPERLEPLALTALADSSADVRATAVFALERVGASPDRAAATVERLVRALADPAPEVRARSADALGWIGVRSPGVLHALDAAGADTSARVSAAARRALVALRVAR